MTPYELRAEVHRELKILDAKQDARVLALSLGRREARWRSST